MRRSSSLERPLRFLDLCLLNRQMLVEHGERVTDFLILLRGSARIMGISKVEAGTGYRSHRTSYHHQTRTFPEISSG